MVVEQWLGLMLTVLGGLLAGTSAWPTKLIRRYGQEHWMFISSVLGLAVLPWTLTFILCPHALSAYGALAWDVWLKAFLFSTAWGIANVFCMLSWRYIGVALTMGLLTGIGLPIGVLVPILLRDTGLFKQAPALQSAAGYLILTATGLMVFGVILAAWAGNERTRNQIRNRRDVLTGVTLAVLAGVLQVGLVFSFVLTESQIMTSMKQYGASHLGANMAVWAVCLAGGGIVNIAFPGVMLMRNRSWGIFSASKAEFLLASILGLTFISFVMLMGSGIQMLGALGASVGFGAYQSMQLSGAQMLGFVTGEWRDAPACARRRMMAAMVLLLVAVLILAYAGGLTSSD